MLVILAETSLLLFALIFWARNKGLDFTDESYYILTLTQPDQSATILYYQHVFHFLFGWLQPGLVGYRLLRLLLIVLTSWLTGHAIARWITTFITAPADFLSGRGIWTLFTFIGLCISYSIYPQCLSYNNLSVIFLAMLLGLILRHQIFSYLVTENRTVRNNLLLIGLISVMLFFTRFSTGILAILIVLSWIIIVGFNFSLSKKSVIRHLLYYVIGMLAFVLFCSIFITSVYSWIDEFNTGVAAMQGHGISRLIDIYTESVKLTARDFLTHFIYYPVILFFWMKTRGQLITKKYGRQLFNSGLIIILSTTALIAWQEELTSSGMGHYYRAFQLHLLILATGFAGLMNKDVLRQFQLEQQNKYPLQIMALLLLTIPIVGSLGTDNFLHVQVLQFMFSWTIFYMFLAIFIFKYADRMFAAIWVVFILVGLYAQVFSGLVNNPYRIQGNLFAQTEPIQLATGENLYVNPATKNYIDHYLGMINNSGYQTGDPILVLNEVPGFIYVAGGTVTGNAWNKNTDAGTICHNLSHADTRNIKNTMIITRPNEVIAMETLECLRKLGIILPNAYKNIGNIRHPAQDTDLAILIPLRRQL